MTRTILPGMALLLLLFIYAGAWLAPVIAPYSHRHQFRDFALAPPSRIVFQSQTGARGPAFHPIRRLDLNPTYEQTGVLVPIRFFVKSEAYTWMGLEFQTHLFGSSDEAQPLVFAWN